MNEIISKWNREIRHIEQETDGPANIKKYIREKTDIDIIDLKYLSSIDKSNLTDVIDNVLLEHKDVLEDNRANTHSCLFYFVVNDNDKCKKYGRCLLCKLDRLSSIGRIMIRKKV